MFNWNGIFSLFIACIELILLVNIFLFAEKNKINKIIFLLITILMAYQFIEFLVCSLKLNYSYILYSAFVVISFLPPLNLIFILMISCYKNKLLLLIFLPALFFTFYYTIFIEKFTVITCTVFYASYNYPLGNLYGFFFYALLAAAIVLLFLKIKNKNLSNRFFLKILLYGLIFTSLPVVAAFILKALNYGKLLSVIESIMCKFAFVYALCLGYFALNNKKVKNE